MAEIIMNAIYVVYDCESKEVMSLHEAYVPAFHEKERLNKQSFDDWMGSDSLPVHSIKAHYVEELRVGNKWLKNGE